ncbi:MAG TPA: heavy-metal-associated domain-containing protein [Quisquiliibacterium sp.]|nr:heavy-metal-associated domain-containing protein [Quisquiliibacterium sp.]HPA90936.1 heavy-metal-associated domain-containing protein [Quisquiliibacterium sp.]HQD82352.1 heavy-metal-associated domain-containing protein [Quisquiliibacterium sp.]HQN13325.1 heavy-metal-associated domain-containing protein [Quisquiliibacterium sp.]HQP68149.1 heavy-metal-associated domain-containing protein [Quisquiliibacterium sp.]
MTEFQIQNMTCGHCAGVVTKAVQAVDPKATLDFDLPAHRVRVESSAPREQLVRSLTDAGYPPA